MNFLLNFLCNQMGFWTLILLFASLMRSHSARLESTSGVAGAAAEEPLMLPPMLSWPL